MHTIVLTKGSGFYDNKPHAQGEPFECSADYARTVIRHGVGELLGEDGQPLEPAEAFAILGLG